MALGHRRGIDTVSDRCGIDLAVDYREDASVVGTGENHPREEFFRLITSRFQAGLGKQMPRGRAWVNEGEGMPLEVA
ncbi:hypothetical protein D3C77_649720 [compost metagenome]